MPQSHKPCPGCGSTAGRAANEVCYACQGLLKEALAVRKTQDEARKSESIVLQVPTSYYELPHLLDVDREFEDAFQKSFKSLAELVSEPFHPRDGAGYGDAERLVKGSSDHCHSGEHYKARIIHQATADALRSVYASALAAVRSAYLNGVERGQSIVCELASGDLSMSKLSEGEVRRAQLTQENKEKFLRNNSPTGPGK